MGKNYINHNTCHRIIGKDGSLTGCAGVLHLKKWLLEKEFPVKQQALF
jgi:methylated-DNA-[protein]-cysteine S-methyltransferase